MRKSGRSLLVLAVLLSFLLGASVSVAAAPPPVLSALQATPTVWDPGAGPLTITANSSAAGKWQLELLDACAGTTVRSVAGSVAAPSQISLTVDGLAEPRLASGVFEVVLTPSTTTGVWGEPVSTSVTVGKASSAAARVLELCPNASRLVANKNVDGAVAAAVLRARTDQPSVRSVFLVGASKSLALSAVAAVAASQRRWPVLLTAGDKLSYATKVELKRRSAAKVVLLGSTSSVSAKVATTLRKLGYQVVRKDTESPLDLAKSIYAKAAGPGGAVYADLFGPRPAVLQAVAFASASGQPLVHLSAANATEVKRLLKTWNRAGGTAVGALPEAAVTAVGAVKVPVERLSSASLALARAVSQEVGTLHLAADGAGVEQWQVLSFAKPQLLLSLPASGVDLATRTWLNARGDVQSLALAPRGPTDQQAAQLARLILARGEPTAIETLEPAPLGALEAPATFAFSGAGWGHGVGMSQWGAYQLATEGKTAAEIVQYYFQGTKVSPAPAAADIFVSLQNRISEVKFRVLPLNNSTPSWRAIAENGDGTTSVVLTAEHTVTLKYQADGQVKTTINGPGSLTLPVGANVRFTWSGSRYAGTLGEAPALLQVAGPGESLTVGRADSGRRYRFGAVRVKAAVATSSLPAGLQVTNRVRLADEYIYGIGEVSSSWPSAALEAQVLAARSYAYHDVYEADGTLSNRSSTCDCHVYDDTRDQNYVGWSKLAESVGDRWKAAVDASVLENADALVVKYGNVIVQTFFAASTGGATQNVQDVWGGSGKPYLVSVPDPYSLLPAGAAGLARWSPRVRAQQTLADAFSLPQVATLDFSDRYESGAVRKVTATAPDGRQATITGEAFRVRVKSDTGTTLNSTWIWRSLVSPRLGSARAAGIDLSADSWLGYVKAPAAAATTAVLVEQRKGADGGLFAVAAAHAGARGWLLVPVAASGDGNRVKTLLQSRGITAVLEVGELDPDLTAKLAAAKFEVREAFGEELSEVAANLADELPNEANAVLVSGDEPRAWPLAVSVAARTGAALLLVSAGALPPATSVWLAAHPKSSVLAVGSASAIPDRLLAGLTSVKRLNTADLAIASRAALALSTQAVRAVAVASSSGSVEGSMTVAALGFPLLYPDADNSPAMLDWLRRQSLAACIVDGGAEAEWVTAFSRA